MQTLHSPVVQARFNDGTIQTKYLGRVGDIRGEGDVVRIVST